MEIHQPNHPLRLLHKNMLQYLDQPQYGECNNEVLANIHDVLKITQAKNILEIGFNRGSSASMFLMSNEDVFVTSIDLIYNPKSTSTLNLLFGNRFEFIQMNSSEILNNEKFKNRYGLIFIDGDHSGASIQNDTDASLSLNTRFILYDDYFHPAHHQDMITFVSKHPRLKLIKEYGASNGRALFFVLSE